MTRYDAVNYISHGISKRPQNSETRPPAQRAQMKNALAQNRKKAPRRSRTPCLPIASI